MRKKRFMSALLACMLMMMGVFAGTGSATKSTSGFEIQCVVDQHSAVPGGKVRYHILYHNVQNKSISKAWLKVKIPNGLELDEVQGADWNGADGTLNWNLKDIDSNGAGVVHFNLKVKDDVENQTDLKVSFSGGVGNALLTEGQPVSVKVGPEIHQPVFNGYPDGKFHPERLLTRAETAATIARVMNLPAASKSTVYQDVSPDHWAYGYIQRVTASGYMLGDQGKFRPDEPIRRAEFIVLMLRVKGIQAVPLDAFADSKEHWADDEIGTTKLLQYTDGLDKDIFNPDGYVNREESSKLLAIMLYRGELKDGDIAVIQHWPDVAKDRWSFGWIEELSLVAHESKNVGLFTEKLVRYLPDQTKPL
ncbi:MAG: hypothetical protein K0Q73_6961 [Paenibacillus sp.]|jgi:hypothetical protein|nr:hypothetical protein [Paenibacillus sp.]